MACILKPIILIPSSLLLLSSTVFIPLTHPLLIILEILLALAGMFLLGFSIKNCSNGNLQKLVQAYKARGEEAEKALVFLQKNRGAALVIKG